MKKIIYIALILIGVNTSIDSFAQVVLNGEAEISDVRLDKRANQLRISMEIDVSHAIIKSNRELQLTPLLKSDERILALPSVVVTGRKSQIYRDRNPKYFKNENNLVVVRKGKDEAQFIHYETYIAYEDWMNGAELVVDEDECGCSTVLLANDQHYLDQFIVPITLAPSLSYLQPEIGEVKTREIQASANLDFPVNGVTIQPNYRNNSAEINKIRESLDKVLEDKDVEVSAILLKGHASPEGPYAGNERLARSRTQALRDYLFKVYPQLTAGSIKVDFVAENWDGLKKMVEESHINAKHQVLDIIDSTHDLDLRERKIRFLNGGAVYREMVNNMFPALRNTDYTIEYVIRDFNPEEARELIWTNPQVLSLEEIFAVSKFYDWKSREYSEIFEIAVRLFPHDNTAKINAAVSALVKKDLITAKTYLDRIEDKDRDGNYYNKLGVYYMLSEKYDLAEETLVKAMTKGSTNAEENLRQTRLKIEELQKIKK